MKWKIDLTVGRKLRDCYLSNGEEEVAKSVNHVESPHEGKTINLLTLEQLQELKLNSPDTVLVSIFGEEEPAKDIDEDTRGGYVSAGFLE